MTYVARPRARAAGSLLVLLLAAGAACSSGSGVKPTAAPTVVSSPSAVSPGSAGSDTTSNSRACRSPTTGTGGAGGGDVLVPGDIPDAQQFVTYHSSDGYHLDYPEGWAQVKSGSAVTFTDKLNSVRVEVTSTPAAPSVTSAQTDEVVALAASAPCFQAGKVSQVGRKAGGAVLITYRADSAPDPVTGKVVLDDVERYEFWQSGKLVTITLSSPKGSDNVDPWRKLTDSFTWGQ